MTDIKQVIEAKKAPSENISAPKLRGVFLHQIIKADGTKFIPDEFGYFVPKDLEEVKLCEHYLNTGRLIVVEEE